MNHPTSLWKANISNQTALWQRMGCEAVSIQGEGWLQSLSWPYKLWPESGKTALTIRDLVEAQPHLHARTRVPFWSQNEVTLPWQQEMPPVSSEQILMYRGLQDQPQTPRQQNPKGIRLNSVQTPSQLYAWWQICEQAFAYEIDIQVIQHLARQADLLLLLAEKDNEAVGTAILFTTGQVAGLHQLGVAQAAQGQGVARAMMHQLLAIAGECRAQWMTLQASSKGLGLYEQLGFSRQGVVRNYSPKNTELA